MSKITHSKLRGTQWGQTCQRRADEDPPARAAVEVARLPKDVRVEIEAVGLVE